jgi:uncharacterized protein (TIGR02391 family)
MQSIYSLMPDHEALLALEPEELAGIVLEYLHSFSTQLNRYNFSLSDTVKEYPYQHQAEISRALMEAWVWLEREGLLAPKPGDSGNWVFITRRGRKLEKAVDVEAYRKTNLLPKQLLHPVIAYKVWSLFLRGEYDTAVFQAFKEVEVAVRDAGGYGKKDYGVNLMRQAFHPQNGTLTDANQLPAEKEATLALFAGAIGLYKNPPSHRNVNITPVEAAEMIIFASSLLKIVNPSTSASAAT